MNYYRVELYHPFIEKYEHQHSRRIVAAMSAADAWFIAEKACRHVWRWEKGEKIFSNQVVSIEATEEPTDPFEKRIVLGDVIDV